MPKTKTWIGILVAAIAIPVLASDPESKSEVALVSSADFTALTGDRWNGSLFYLDYSSNAEARIPVKFQFEEPGPRTVFYHIAYPGEAQFDTTEKLTWSRDGRKLNGARIVSRCLNADGTITLITQFDGEDDKRPAEIRMTYSLDSNALSIRKDVRFEGDVEFFRRSAYELGR